MPVLRPGAAEAAKQNGAKGRIPIDANAAGRIEFRIVYFETKES